MAKVKHWLELNHFPLKHVIPADLRDTACGLTFISESEQKDRYSRVPTEVTCQRCRRAYNFGQRGF